MATSRRLRLAALALVAALLPGIAEAQLPQPRLQAVYPPGGRAGETVEVQLAGADLEGVDALWFDHPGLRAFRRKAGTFVVAIATGVPVGHHDLRAVGPLGVSNPRAFVVGDRPEAREAEPNNTPAQANTIAVNAVVNGRMDGQADVDCFAFEGKAGRRVFLDLAAERIDSRLDAVLHVLDPSGAEIALAHDHFGPDPFLDLTLPADGRYVVRVHDVIYNGSAEYGYRLALHDGPHLDAVVPPTAATPLGLLGRNLGATVAPGPSLDGRPLEQLSFELTSRTFGFRPSVAAAQLGREVRLRGLSAWSNPVFLPDATDPVVLEQEPNDADHPQSIAPPCVVSGTFGAPGDVDVYRFSGRKGDVWWIEAIAERIGSPADPTFLVQKIVANGDPPVLATGDDLPEPAPDPRFAIASVDAAVRWQVPDDGLYRVAIHDLYHSQRGDARQIYRLHIRPERPDFRLFVVPEDAGQPGATVVRAGGRAAARLIAQRLDGFNDPIRVEARDLPPGVACDPVVIGPGQYAASLVLSASRDARPLVAPIALVGRALSPDRKEVLAYTPGASKVRPEPAREAIPGGLSWPPTPDPTGGPPAALARVADGFVIAVREAAPFLLSARPDEIVVGPNATVELALDVARGPGMTEAIQVSATDLPPNLPAASATIAKGANSAALKLTVPANVPPGNYTIVLRGTGPFPFNKDPNAKEKPNVNVNEPSNPIRLTIHR
jgi:hypothetical protein